MKTSLVCVAFLSLAALGCKKKETAADCATAINHSMELSKVEMAKMPGVDASMIQKMTDLGMRRCKEDRWSNATIKCMVDAKTMDAAQSCYSNLTPEQQEKMNKAAMALATPAAAADGSAATGSGPDAAGAATGSDAGSAAVGSGSAGSAAAGSGAADTAGSAAPAK